MKRCLRLDSLEGRDAPAGWLSSQLPHPPTGPAVRVAVVPTLGERVAAFCAAHLGQRVGGGECVHLAAEALRAAGAQFNVFATGVTDYVWGNPLAGPARVGDVIQFAGARFADGLVLAHHTAIVAAVDGGGRVTEVYQQNFAGVRAVTRQPLDLSRLVAGTAKVYRPRARLSLPGYYRFSVVNNLSAPVAVTERAWWWTSAYTLTATDTLASYQARRWVSLGVRPTLTVAGQSVTVVDGAGYEVYRGPTGPAVRKLSWELAA